MTVLRRLRRSVLRGLGIPPGLGILFSTRSRLRLYGVLAGSLLVALMEMVAVTTVLPLMQLLTGSSIDSGVLSRLADFFGADSEEALAMTLAALIFCLFLSKALMTIAFRWWMLGTLMRQEIDTSTRLLRYYLLAPYALHLKRHTGELLRNMNEAVTQVYINAVGGTLAASAELTTILAVTVSLLVVEPVPTLTLIVYFGVAAFVFQRLFQPRVVAAQEQMLRSSLEIFRAATQALGGVKDIKLRGNHDYFLEKFRTGRATAAGAMRERVFLTELPKHIMEILFILGVGLMTIIVFTREDASSQALSLVALFAAAGFRVLPNVVRAIGALTTVRSARASIDLVLDDVRDAVRFTENYQARPKSPIESDVEVLDLSFRYDDGPEVLSGVDLRIPRGTSLALVGGSGAGKTTLVDLLAGLHRPTSGQILRDGVDIHADLTGWQAGVAIVPQSVYLTDEALRENIAFGVPRGDIDEVLMASVVDQAQLREIVEALPEGLDSPIGEAGAQLSGGQRQRIGVARALYAQPTFLILDEATSALDNETERRVTDTIENLAGVVTTVIVAHRLSTVKHCDQLVFLKDGRVEAAGTFDEVRATSPDFERLVRLGNLVST